MAESDQNVQLEQLLHAINHDLRTPLGNIRSAATILLQDLSDPLTKDQRVFLEIINRSVVRILDQSNRLSLFWEVAFRQSELEAVQLSELLANTKKTLRNSYEIEEVIFSTNSDPIVYCHPHVLAALLALLAAGDTKQQPETIAPPPPTIQVIAKPDQVRFSISSQMPAHIFAQTLTNLASEIVQLHDGTLASTVENGRKQFTFTIPHTTSKD
ncbi:histidine kinase dimerization/phospho-acceptor domain-containing protein [Candidatus Leptofilum sp.]|uniref:histidine kinase dimerization/phospho-acceptor domain-containing protein n=1 Tax=Candidatus Leptofilum sp. TaxID=3241576 RepID=UPI003B5A2810